MRSESAVEDRVAREQEMLRREGGGDARRRLSDEGGGLFRRDVLKDHSQSFESFDDGTKCFVEEDALAIEDIDLGPDRFAVHQEGQPRILERFKNGMEILKTGDAL